MLPTFMNIFLIYSFCNVHDVTWGTRDSSLINNEKAQYGSFVTVVASLLSRYKRFRSRFVVFWAAVNFVYAGGILLVSF